MFRIPDSKHFTAIYIQIEFFRVTSCRLSSHQTNKQQQKNILLSSLDRCAKICLKIVTYSIFMASSNTYEL